MGHIKDPPTKKWFRSGHLSKMESKPAVSGSETPAGVEPAQNCFAGSCRAVWLQRQKSSVLARNRTWSSTFAESRANPQHSEDVFPYHSLSAPPRNRTSSCSFEHCRADPAHSQGIFRPPVVRPGIEPGLAASETAVRFRHTHGLFRQSRRLDSHQHQAVYKTAAFLSRATSASIKQHEREGSNRADDTGVS